MFFLLGIEKWPDGSRYEGQFFEGKKHGKGCFSWADGSSYEGDFVENNIHGNGCFLIIIVINLMKKINL